jgi:hypothetical protein
MSVEPEHLCCVITHQLYRDPVILTGSGNTYDRTAILEHLLRSNMDPISNCPLGATELVTNWDKRREVQMFLDATRDRIPEGWDSRDLRQPPKTPTTQTPQPAKPDPEPGHHYKMDYKMDLNLNLEGKHLAVIVCAYIAWRYWGGPS